jgi:hypothetical protein
VAMSRLKGLFSIVIVIAAVWVVWQLAPPYFNSYQFQDFVESEARLNSYNSKTEQDIHDGIMKKARELDIPLEENQLKVVRSSVTELSISAEYTIHVDLPLYPVDLHFAPSSKNKRM